MGERHCHQVHLAPTHLRACPWEKAEHTLWTMPICTMRKHLGT